MIVLAIITLVTNLTTLLIVIGARIDQQSGLLVPHIDQDALVEAVGNKHEANVLRLAAIAYDSVQGQHRVRALSREGAGQDTSVIAAWLNERANEAEARNR